VKGKGGEEREGKGKGRIGKGQGREGGREGRNRGGEGRWTWAPPPRDKLWTRP